MSHSRRQVGRRSICPVPSTDEVTCRSLIPTTCNYTSSSTDALQLILTEPASLDVNRQHPTALAQQACIDRQAGNEPNYIFRYVSRIRGKNNVFSVEIQIIKWLNDLIGWLFSGRSKPKTARNSE